MAERPSRTQDSAPPPYGGGTSARILGRDGLPDLPPRRRRAARPILRGGATPGGFRRFSVRAPLPRPPAQGAGHAIVTNVDRVAGTPPGPSVRTVGAYR